MLVKSWFKHNNISHDILKKVSECFSLLQDPIKMTLERIGKVVVEVYGGGDPGFETCLFREIQ